MKIVYLNGQFMPAEEAKVSVFDRGFLFGDSVYEVIPFYQAVGFRLEEHIQRLRYSLQAIGIEIDQDWPHLLSELVRRNGGGNLSVYLQISRGSNGQRSSAIEPGLTPTVFACCQPIRALYEQGPDAVAGIKVAVVEDIRWQRCDIKATGLLANLLMLQQARVQGAQEALLLKNGWLTEGTSCNFFVVENGVVYTPPLATTLLSGTTRRLVLELAQQQGVFCRQEQIRYERLLQADEVWISSSTRGVVSVLAVDDQPINGGQKGPLWYWMFELFTAYQRQLMQGSVDETE